MVAPYSGMHGIGGNEYRKEDEDLCTQFILERFSFPHCSLLPCKFYHSLLITYDEVRDKGLVEP